MSELRKGDTIYYKGDKGRIINVMADGEGELLEIALTTTKLTYLEQHQLDLYPFPETLNDNQRIVLEWLKGRYKGGSSLFNAIQGFRGFNGVPAIELNALMSLSNNEESQVLQAFATWVLKQEEE